MKLELKHLAPYLPYGLRVIHGDGRKLEMTCGNILGKKEKHVMEINGVLNSQYGPYKTKPILRPLIEYKNFEDILDEFSENDHESLEDAFFLLGRSLNCFDFINYSQIQLMFKHHIDVFGLIEKGLAIDINTLN